jgi:hypothetical protein
MATARQRSKRALVARFPAPPMRIVKADMRAQSSRGCTSESKRLSEALAMVAN